MIKWKNLSFQYPNVHLKFPDFEAKNKKYLFIGESGKGKTTLLHLITGLLSPKTGTVNIAGSDIYKLSKTKLDKFRGQNIGIVFQQSHFIQSVSVLENLQLACYFAKRNTTTKEITSILESLGLGDKLFERPTNLSIGQQQRVSIARAIITKPNIIVADEPTSALDDKNCATVIELLRDQVLQIGATLLIVTHDKRLKDVFTNHINLNKDA